jgi:quinol monooxygenase YgiN
MRHFLPRQRLALFCLASLLSGSGCISLYNRSDRSTPQENIHAALLVRMEVKPGQDREVLKLLQGGLPLVQAEPATLQWFALRFGPTSFGIFDTFLDETGRQAHLQGPLAAALTSRASELFTHLPDIQSVEPIATKAPPLGPDATVHQGLVITLEARPGKENEVKKFLEESLHVVRDEPGTTHWFAFRLSPSKFGIVDTFPSEAGIQAHLNGRVAEELMERTKELLASPPVVEQVDVITAKP